MPPALPGYDVFTFAAGAYEHPVYVGGEPSAPPVLVMCEIAGFSPGLIRFTNRLQQAGFQVFVPWLFGSFGQRAPMRNAVRLCISREFGHLRAGTTAPVTNWLRALAGEMSRRTGRDRVGAIGMCLTGALVIPLIIDPCVRAAVAAQPAIPCSLLYVLLGIRQPRSMRALNVADDDVACARARLASGEAHLLAVRARADRICPEDKILRLQEEFPIGLTVRQFGDETDRNGFGERPHALLTKEHRIAPDAKRGHWAHDAFVELTSFLEQHLTQAQSIMKPTDVRCAP